MRSLGRAIAGVSLEGTRARCFRTTVIVALILLGIAPAIAQTTVPVSGSIPPGASRLGDLSALPEETPIEVSVSLALRHREKLQQFLEAVQNPFSPQYHHWMSSEEFEEQFGPSAEQSAAVAQWLSGAGMKVERVGRELSPQEAVLR